MKPKRCTFPVPDGFGNACRCVLERGHAGRHTLIETSGMDYAPDDEPLTGPKQSDMTEDEYFAYDPNTMAPERRSEIRDCIHGRHARKCPECDLILEVSELREQARRVVNFAGRAYDLWCARPFEDTPLNQIMNSLYVAAKNLSEFLPTEEEEGR